MSEGFYLTHLSKTMQTNKQTKKKKQDQNGVTCAEHTSPK